MKIVCVSDTHLAEPELPEGDVLIHAGDLTYRGRPHEIYQQLEWLKRNRHKYKHVIVIAGNHDWGFETNGQVYREIFAKENIIVLEDQEVVLDGVKFYGSPVQPEFCNWAFNKKRGEEIALYWDMIPLDVDVLITHGPPYGTLDKTKRDKQHVGCEDLRKRIAELKQLKLHVFGHIHEEYGQVHKNGVQYVNASIMTLEYNPENKPIIYEL